ncbi:hypothetical protein ADL12_07380 [Streptomyces regalis]|uniref:catalase n=1 Tax=Streptomyces regalis TaxID=68262 RepID=A0A0X3VFN6_9ACTN|nr:hypothetical protein ADL12_07380 [Streptomyces regalis]
MADWEKQHIVAAFRFELGKVGAKAVRTRTVEHLAKVNGELAVEVARGIGVPEPSGTQAADKLSSPALSLESLRGDGSIRTRQVAVLVADGVDTAQVTSLREALAAEGAIVEALAPTDGAVTGADGERYAVDRAGTPSARLAGRRARLGCGGPLLRAW